MTNTIGQRNKPYYQIYMKDGGAYHIRYKFVDGDGNVYIRGLNKKEKKLYGPAIYEDGEFDAKNISINDPIYIAGDKFYLNSEQEENIKKKIQHHDSNKKKISYNATDNNCVDFNHSIISEIDKNKTLEDFLNDNQKKIAASRGYNFVKYGDGKDTLPLASKTLLSINPTGGAFTASLATETAKILKRKNLLVSPEAKLAPKEPKNLKNLLEASESKAQEGSDILRRANLIEKYSNKRPEQTPLPRTPGQEEKIKSIISKITEHDDKRTDALYKQPQDLTENEARSAMQLARYESNDVDLNNRLEQKAKSYYDSLYSNKNLERDATGRQINPKPQYTPLTEPKELRTKDNILMREAYQSIAERTEQTGVKSLQRGLNSFPYQTPLKEDDDLGPKTASRLKENLVTHGLDKTQESIKEDVAAREEAERKEREAEAKREEQEKQAAAAQEEKERQQRQMEEEDIKTNLSTVVGNKS